MLETKYWNNMRECHAWMNATIKHDKRWIAKPLEVGPITGRPSGVCRHENGKPMGGKLAFRRYFGSNASGVGPWLGLIASEMKILLMTVVVRCDWFRWFRSGSPLPMPYRAPYARDPQGGWMAQWRAWIRMDGRIFVGTVVTCSPRTLRCQGSVFSYLTMENPSWYQPQGVRASLNHDRFVDVSGMIKNPTWDGRKIQ